MASKVICDNCGNECAADLVREYSTGRRVLRICPDCQKAGEKQHYFITHRVNRYAKKSRRPDK